MCMHVCMHVCMYAIHVGMYTGFLKIRTPSVRLRSGFLKKILPWVRCRSISYFWCAEFLNDLPDDCGLLELSSGSGLDFLFFPGSAQTLISYFIISYFKASVYV